MENDLYEDLAVKQATFLWSAKDGFLRASQWNRASRAEAPKVTAMGGLILDRFEHGAILS